MNLLNQLYPEYINRHRTLSSADIELVHYTNIDAAEKIVGGDEFWLRNARNTNDFTEINLGISYVENYFSNAKDSPIARDIEKQFSRFCPNLFPNCLAEFGSWKDDFEKSTFLGSLSVLEGKERDDGRLSMWRGYGGKSPVALVINKQAVASETDVTHVFTYPVLYFDEQKIQEELEDLAESLLKLVDAEPKDLQKAVFQILKLFCLSCKSSDFREETEWRLAYSPTYKTPKGGIIEERNEEIRGKFETIQALKLQDLSARGLHGLATNEVIERAIVGPSNRQEDIKRRLISVFKSKGFENAEEKVACSSTPFRLDE